MRIRGLVWFGEVVEKLWVKHHVQKSEVREIFNSKPHFRFVEKGHRPNEDVYAALGRTVAGRYIIVYFIYKKDGRAIIVTAHEMSQSERKKYEKK